MRSEAPIRQARGEVRESTGREPWFATFMFLDAGCAISSTQLEHLTAPIGTFWRWMTGRLV